MCVFVPAWRFETPQQVQFVEKLSDVVIGQLPNFWKLWISYVNGSLFSEVNTWKAFTVTSEKDTVYNTQRMGFTLIAKTFSPAYLSWYPAIQILWYPSLRFLLPSQNNGGDWNFLCDAQSIFLNPHQHVCPVVSILFWRIHRTHRHTKNRIQMLPVKENSFWVEFFF